MWQSAGRWEACHLATGDRSEVRATRHTHTGARNHCESSVRRRERGRRQCRVSCSAWFNDTQVLSVRWLRDPRVLFAQRWWTEVLLPVPRGQSLARLSTMLTVSGHKPLAKQFRNFWGEITAAFTREKQDYWGFIEWWDSEWEGHVSSRVCAFE